MSKNKKDVEAIYPCTPLQAGMVFHTIESREAGTYIEQLGCMVRGTLNLPTLERACSITMNRHSILRTSFAWKSVKQPVQVVKRTVAPSIRFLDWHALTENVIKQQLKELQESDRQEGFNLAKAPLWRLTAVTINNDRFFLLLSYHHALLDGWSLSLLIKELLTVYRLECMGTPIALEQPIGFGTYIAWIQRQDIPTAEQVWRDYLTGFGDPTLLPGNVINSGERVLSPRKASHSLNLSEALTDDLLDSLKRHQLTLNTLVQTAWALLLASYTGIHDVVFGATVSGRPPTLEGVERVLGLFINTLPVRVTIDARDTLVGLLERVQRDGAKLREYDYMPLVNIQRCSDISAGVPLFQTLAVVENLPTTQSVSASEGSSQNDLTFLEVNYEGQTHYPLVLTVIPGRALHVQFFYDSTVYDEASISQLAHYFLELLVRTGSCMDVRVADFLAPSPQDRTKILVDWNNSYAEFPRKGIHEIFDLRVEENPFDKAVIGYEETLSYGELHKQANQLAQCLTKRGVASEVPVGVIVDRSAKMIVSLLGILKAGGTYVPIDPEYPAERIRHILNNSGVRLIVAQETLPECLVTETWEIFYLDRNWEVVEEINTVPHDGFVSAQQMAYITYTSGSTGNPKGVAVSHENVVKLAFGTDAKLGRGRNVLAASSIAFDASTFEIWGALLQGSTIVLHQEKVPTPESLRAVIQRHSVHTAWLTSSLFNAIIDSDPECLLGIEQVLIGGEALSSQHVKQAYNTLPASEIINGYGPTEATTFATNYLIPRDIDGSNTGNIPIGRPIANTKLYVLNRFLNPVPIGARGELYIGGLGVSRGYHGLPGLTAEKFIPNPFGNGQNSRLYRTGDIVRYQQDGVLEFLGRADNQVKIRGFRIELSEIEITLLSHPDIQQAAVGVHDLDSGDKRLIAYLVVLPDRHTTLGAELPLFLRSRLPKYMIPATCRTVDVLPLNRNGKIDRRALSVELGTELYSPELAWPRNTTEEALADIWRSVLGPKTFGIQDDFFDIGGHSLLVARLFALIEREFKVALPASLIFEAPTIELLAQKIATSHRVEQYSHIVPIRPMGSGPSLFCIHPAAGDVLCYMRLARRLRKNGGKHPIYGIQVAGLEVDLSNFGDLESMASHYIQELKAVRPAGPYVLMGYSMGGVVAFEMARQLHELGEPPLLVSLIDTFVPVGVLPQDDADYMVRFFSKELSMEELRQLSQDERMHTFMEKAIQSGILPPNANRDQAQCCFDIIKHNIDIVERYKPMPYSGSVQFFLAGQQRAGKPRRDTSLGWKPLVLGELKVHCLDCNHHGILRKPKCVQALAPLLQESITDALESLEEESAMVDQ